MTTRAKARFWRAEQGWGVVDAPSVPGGCWVHFSAVAVDGYRTLTAGSWVNLEAEPSDVGTFRYAATRVWPEGAEPAEQPEATASGSSADTSSLTVRFDDQEQ